MKSALILILCIVSPLSWSIEIYTWVDEKGMQHFSDHPDSPQASLIVLPDPPAPYLGDEVSPATRSFSETPTLQPIRLKVSIRTPTHDATIRNNAGNFDVVGHIDGKLHVSAKLQLLLDGKVYGAPKSTPHWSLSGIDRGTHTLTIQAQQNGKVIASSNTITVHLHRASVQSP
ncbi:DUF4124 domain-containing protein [Vibrio barjaei]|uniref:DUF4124 domain-containing protein n=1 Tax=Vibrio barjaei TaxID=1676683 RepID=UPI002284AB8A|nr:DUF4124 domain-containing protein [Vibrio barjaei]MCY9873657.1 DUF4124 domain-containing protein [Vibrio barjaei]